jgi:hypothetical protein
MTNVAGLDSGTSGHGNILMPKRMVSVLVSQRWRGVVEFMTTTRRKAKTAK